MKIEGPLRDTAWAAGGVAFAILALMLGLSIGRLQSVDRAAATELAEQRAKVDGVLRRTQEQIKANQSRLDRLDTYERKATALRKQIDSRTQEVTGLDQEIAGKRQELGTLTSRVEQKRSEPMSLPAGHFTVGRDIPAGRYTVVGSSNFIVNSGMKVNTILGGGSIGVDQYVCELEVGDRIEAGGANQYYPM